MSNLEKLKDIQTLRYKIKKQEELIEYYETMARSVGGCDFSTERVDCSRNLEAPFVKWIIKKLDAEDKLKEMNVMLEKKIDEMMSVVEKIENIDYRKIITYRYLLFKEWFQISKSLCLSLSSVYRFHRIALKELEKIDI